MTDRRPDARLLHVVPPRPVSFPVPLTGFVGREREIAAITDLLTRTRLLTLSGLGGSGKTRLAIETAAALRPAFARSYVLGSRVGCRNF